MNRHFSHFGVLVLVMGMTYFLEEIVLQLAIMIVVAICLTILNITIMLKESYMVERLLLMRNSDIQSYHEMVSNVCILNYGVYCFSLIYSCLLTFSIYRGEQSSIMMWGLHILGIIMIPGLLIWFWYTIQFYREVSFTVNQIKGYIISLLVLLYVVGIVTMIRVVPILFSGEIPDISYNIVSTYWCFLSVLSNIFFFGVFDREFQLITSGN